jgi:predicted permease
MQNHTFEDMAVYTYQESFNASGTGEPERAAGVELQANYFSMLGVPAALGRTFLPGEDQAGQNRVVLLSYGFWQRRFAGQRSAVGGSMELNGEQYKIVGVMPTWFRVPGSADFWVPIDMSLKNLGPRGEHHLRALGRVKSGVPIEQARADLLALSQRLEQQFPDSNRNAHAVVVPLKDQLVGSASKTQLGIMLGAVGLVLLIACANVANLLLARASDRRREVAVRAALGAERSRLVRQLLTESVLLSVFGALPGIALAYVCVTLLGSGEHIPFTLPNPVAVNPAVLAFTLGVSVLVGLLFGLAPALQTSHINLSDELKSGGKMAATATTRNRLLRDVLMTGEIAVSLALLASAGLLLRTFANLREVNPGVRMAGVLTARVLLPSKKYATPEQQRLFYTRLVDTLSASPGVRAAAVATEIPLEGGSNGYVQIEGQAADSESGPLVEWNSITPDYFRTMGISLLSGRNFTETDLENTETALKKLIPLFMSGELSKAKIDFELTSVINQAMAKRFWPGQDPVGKRFRIGGSVPVHVVGMVADVKSWGLRQAPPPQAYYPLTWAFGPQSFAMTIVAQSAGRPEAIASAMRNAVESQDSTLAIFQMRSMQQVIADAMSGESDQTILLGTFAGLALLLAAVGTYGVMSYLVTQRTAEIGIRMALGAGRGEVVWMVLRQGVRLAVVGVILGIGGALATTRLLASTLYGVKANDPQTLIAVSLVMCGVAMLACMIPALRAMRVNPVIALRYE